MPKKGAGVNYGRLLFFAGVAICARPALAADALKFGAAPPWVRPQAVPADSGKNPEAPVALLLRDEQIRFDRGKSTTYSEGAVKYRNAQGLAAGNIVIAWQPATDTVTVNKLQIRRGDKIIDVLAGGQTFTVLRRETNLDAATLDGTLTATLQPEGLQVGDIIDFATTTEHSDPVLKGHVEATFARWNIVPVQVAHATLSWPSDIPLQFRQTPNLPIARKSSAGGMTVVELSATDVQPIIPPKGAPDRFKIGRLAEATDFTAWSDLANLFAPLYRDASAIPASGPLHDEVERIRATGSDPKKRAEQALSLVQDRVRYVALLMGQGGYVPASADVTWSRRFGDCKAKTALLLGLLHSLGIEAEPVAVQAGAGDMIADRLPMVELFNHVLVRAHIGGKDYWLDGTRSGDTNLDTIEVPDFRWGLPLAANAKLVRMVPAPLAAPNLERHLTIDMSKGVFAPAPVSIEELYRGDAAVALNTAYSTVTAEQRDLQMHREAKSFFDTFTPISTALQFDKVKRELRIAIKGTARLNWKDSWLYVPTSSIAFTPDFERSAGTAKDAPWAVDHPRHVKDSAAIRLPPGFAETQKLSSPVNETLAGIQYRRTENVSGDVITVESGERSVTSEIPYKDALAAAARLKALANEQVYLQIAPSYMPTGQDLASLKQTQPQSGVDYFVRADAELKHSEADAALADLDAGLALSPKDAWALKKRAWIKIQRQHLAEAEKDLEAAASVDDSDMEVVALRGQLAMSKGDIGGALRAFEEALRGDPKNVMAHFGRAKILLRQGKAEDALAELTAALASDPHDAATLAQRAEILEYRNDGAGADRDIAAAMLAEPGNADVLAMRAGIATARKDYPTAKEFVQKALARDPNNTIARNLQAQLLQREGNEDQALASVDAAVANSPKDTTALINRAFAYADAKKFDAAEKDIAAALAIEPTNLRALRARAAVANAKGNFSGAVEALTSALAVAPTDAEVLQARADAYRRLGKFDLALADTDMAIKGGLVSPSLRLLRINILVGKGEPQAIAAEVEQLLKESPTSDFALVVAGKTYAAIGMRDKAMASFSRALELKPFAYIYINRSQVRPYSDYQGKLADLDAALKLEPNHEDAMAEKARLLSRNGKHDTAVQLYDQAIKTALDTSYLELGRAVALQKAGRLAEAKVAFDGVYRKAKTAGDFSRICWAKASEGVLLDSALHDCRHGLDLDPEYPGLQEPLGLVLLKLGKPQDALIALNKAIETKSGAEAYMIRAIARSRLGDSAGARTDASEAHRLRADVDDRVADFGVSFDKSSAPAASR